jgi:sterol 3beta-glucosyltransferase
MKITVNTFGTRGDVQPYIALSLGLERSGHQVRILSHDIFEADVKNHGLDFYPLALNPHEVLVNHALSELGNNIIKINQWMGANFRLVLRDFFTTTLNANKDAELVINSGLSFAG